VELFFAQLWVNAKKYLSSCNPMALAAQVTMETLAETREKNQTE